MPQPQSDDDKFTDWLLSGLVDLTKSLGYTPTYFIKMVRDDGGRVACKKLLRPEAPASSGFCRLHRMGKKDWTIEAVALSSQWGHLFSEDEKATAKFRLEHADLICSDPSMYTED